ncbi:MULTISPECIES: NAD-dependent epimerase/dehydratase family protein [unclassified Rhizobium]|uniref:NAD-dependent epimerase/dehydratase family protein n=1 Tax=unclassified Rhizobium TaxID=2613769 RepID=UPI001AD9A378|nr:MULTISPECIES: NAD(P)-dependent oxidoreductase [unclassified Rhizobium]MBO9100949.1 NAD(P)-dependent oxidoreductase [Rhizobium sp. L58/93]MBO9136954.1 NAD(P)-dependent oxidoreductase [Rhizobium sp. B209b/85]MBO9170719.1 NAD(P)-dependent oxidoreductase [Rhizobium sp. L245/93]MBO9188196.1 NAD(P)-dependent oxidoreductase [Rhizobium sp. E27B/91]QXZ86170.1 NAD(P)-dependent oxidoreductase [Rhizobium sp. K1/93]
MVKKSRLIVTGSSGRVGQAICAAAASTFDVIGIDRLPGPTTSVIGDVTNYDDLARAFAGAQAVIHSAGLHAPHVNTVPDCEFQKVNVVGTLTVAKAAIAAGTARIIFTSTTALYGAKTEANGAAEWINASAKPKPRTIYHFTKIKAEECLAEVACRSLHVTILRIARCFPESPQLMALYRLHRGIDIRDVASAHLRALQIEGAQLSTHIVSATTPFLLKDCETLGNNALSVIQKRCPGIVQAFRERGWTLPRTIDRVYDNSDARLSLKWKPQFGYEAVLSMLDDEITDGLPRG